MAETLTYANAKINVARTIGGQNDADQIAAAGDAINFAIDEWNWRHNWRYLLMDNDQKIRITGITSSGSGNRTLTAGTDEWKNAYAGNRIWDVDGDPTTDGTIFTAGTKIASKTTNSVIVVDTDLKIAMDGDAGTITTPLDDAYTDGRIPIIAGQSVYRITHPMKRPYTARLVSKNQALIYDEMRSIDRTIRDIETQGSVTHYTMYADTNIDAQGFSSASLDDRAGWIKLMRVPDYTASNELLLRYYRPISFPSGTGVSLDIPNHYIRSLLILAKYYYLVDKDAESARTQEHKQRAEMALRQCIADDVGVEDRDTVLVSQMDYGQAYGSDIDSWID